MEAILPYLFGAFGLCVAALLYQIWTFPADCIPDPPKEHDDTAAVVAIMCCI